MARAFFAGHNYQINLEENQEGTEVYHQMFSFLRQSRIHHVLTHAPVISEPYLIEFWANARYIKRDNGEVIESRVAQNNIEFTAEDLRVILELGTEVQEGGAEGLTVFDRSIIVGGFRRMGFAGDITKSTLFKKGFFGRWRYLAHVVLVGLSNKKTGWDTLSQETQAQLVGIVYNKPYSFSKYFFNEFRKQISARGTMRFLMYPRFVMMILNARLPNLPIVEPVRKVTTLIKRSYNEFMTRNANDPNAQDVDLFGAIIDINFVTPSDEAIASYEDLPAAEQQPPHQQQQQLQPQQPQQQQNQAQHQSEMAEGMINIMLDEQEANPEVAQAVIHELLQENAPVDDPVADVEAFYDHADKEMQIDESSSESVDSDDSNDSSSDDDDQDGGSQRAKIVRIGSRMVSVGESSSGSKRKESVDPDYELEEEEALETPLTKKARTSKSVPTIAEPTFQPSTSGTVEDQLIVMKAQVQSLTDEMVKQRVEHTQEVEVLKKKNEKLSKEMNDMRRLVTRLAQSVDESRVRVDGIDKDHSTQLAKLQVKVGEMDDFSKKTVNEASSMAQHIHDVLDSQHQGIIRVNEFAEKLDKEVAMLGMRIDIQATCRNDPLRNAGRRDGDDDPDLAREGRMPSFHEDLAHHVSTSKGESHHEVGQSSGGARDDIQNIQDFDTGFVNTSSSDIFDHDKLIREIQIKFGHDKLLAENVYADLMESKFQKETALELCNKNKEQSLADSLSSSDSDYVPEKDN